MIERLKLVEETERRVKEQSVSLDSPAWVVAAIQSVIVQDKLNEIIDRLNQEPTLDELVEHLQGSLYGTDTALAASIRRARDAWDARQKP